MSFIMTSTDSHFELILCLSSVTRYSDWCMHFILWTEQCRVPTAETITWCQGWTVDAELMKDEDGARIYCVVKMQWLRYIILVWMVVYSGVVYCIYTEDWKNRNHISLCTRSYYFDTNVDGTHLDGFYPVLSNAAIIHMSCHVMTCALLCLYGHRMHISS